MLNMLLGRWRMFAPKEARGAGGGGSLNGKQTRVSKGRRMVEHRVRAMNESMESRAQRNSRIHRHTTHCQGGPGAATHST